VFYYLLGNKIFNFLLGILLVNLLGMANI